jgi:putative SOS response-associated peptidase YedK
VEHFALDQADEYRPEHNRKPTQAVPAVLRDPQGRRVLRLLRWGLQPGWARPDTFKKPLINARAESVAQKPAFRDAFRTRRCLVPADVFYEWTGEPGSRTPWAFALRDGAPMGLAGLWEGRETSDGWQHSVCIVTCPANALVAAAHHRMPVILPPDVWAAWLDPATPPDQAGALLLPYPAEAMASHPVQGSL